MSSTRISLKFEICVCVVFACKFQSTRFLMISVGYLCMAKSSTRLPSSVTKPSNYNNLRILLLYSLACSEVIYVRPTANTVFIDKHCCSSVLIPVWNSFPSFVRTADSFTSFRSQLKTYMFARHFVAGPLSAPLIPFTGFFARYKFVTYLFTYSLTYLLTYILTLNYFKLRVWFTKGVD